MVKPGKCEIFVVLFLGVCERESAFPPEIGEEHEIGNYGERMKCNVVKFILVSMFREEAGRS